MFKPASNYGGGKRHQQQQKLHINYDFAPHTTLASHMGAKTVAVDRNEA